MSEIEAHCRKAARGAGLSFGEAEDAGQAVRRLSAAGLHGADALLRYLIAQREGRIVDAADPIKLGIQLIDGITPDLKDVHTPLLLLPFIGFLAADRGTSLSLTGQRFHGVTGADGSMHLACDAEQDGPLSIAQAKAPDAALVWRAECSKETYDALNAFCMNTYAPETDERRNAGAGAGDDGND